MTIKKMTIKKKMMIKKDDKKEDDNTYQLIIEKIRRMQVSTCQ
jgi:hypothetical protein